MASIDSLKKGADKAKSLAATGKNLTADAKALIGNVKKLTNALDNVATVGTLSKEYEGSVDSVSLKSGVGTIDSAISNTFRGTNYYNNGSAAPLNNEQQGMVFFTRPLMNLSYDNIIQDRSMTLMLSNEEYSIPRAIRAILDPVGANGYRMLNKEGPGYLHPPHGSGLVDNKSAFINLLSNNLISLTGWPDPYVDTYTTKGGMYKEEFSMVDGVSKIFNSYDLSANFRNIQGDPISYLFHVWTQYSSLVHEGVLDPRPEFILENEIDYNTRCYRLILDPSRRFVLKIGATGAGFPTTNSLGAHFNFNNERPFNRENDQLAITFKSMGAMYYDPILIYEFNRVVTMFNPSMDGLTEKSQKRSSALVYIQPKIKPLFNNMSVYPRINPSTMELEWWISKADYEGVMKVSNLTGKFEDSKGYGKFE